MSDDALLVEVIEFASYGWRRQDLVEHSRTHRRDFQLLLGRLLSPDELQELSVGAVQQWERLFTGLEPGGITYVFGRPVADIPGVMLLVGSRRGRLRTAFPADADLWAGNRRRYIEVTARVRAAQH
jgi:hypothetical protein